VKSENASSRVRINGYALLVASADGFAAEQ